MARNGQETITACFAIVRAHFLTPEEKTLWLLYRSYDSGRGAWPSDEQLAGHMGKSKRSVQGYRASLMGQGFLRQELRGPKTARYRAVIPMDEDDEASQHTANHDSESFAPDCEGGSVENPPEHRNPLRTFAEKLRSRLRDVSQPVAAKASQPIANRVRKGSTDRSTNASPFGEAIQARAREGNSSGVETSERPAPPMREPRPTEGGP